MGSIKEVPDFQVGDLRPYVPAVRFAVRLAREREAELADRFEPHGERQARKHRERLQRLRRILNGGLST